MEENRALGALTGRQEVQIKKLKGEQNKRIEGDKRYPEVLEVLNYWRDKLHPGATSFRGERQKKVLEALKEGHTVAKLKQVVDGYAAFPYVVNSRRVAYGTPAQRRVDAELIFRDEQRIDQGVAFAKEVAHREQVIPQVAVTPATQQLGELGQAAVALANFGWHVFPVHPKAKTPATQHGLKDATRDIVRITNFWLRNPNHNIGVRCGVESGIIVLDVDDRNGGNESLRELEKQYGELPKTLSVVTPGGGQHYYFRYNDSMGEIHNTAGYPAPGCDIRAQNGYVLAPPSINDKGKRYEVDERSPIAPMPAWLLEKLINYQTSLKSMSAQEWVDKMMKDVPEGGRDNALTSITGKYLAEGLSEEYLLPTVWAQNLAHCKPPLSAKDVQRIVKSILSKDRRSKARRVREQLSLEGAQQS